jgi:hypothetical protein
MNLFDTTPGTPEGDAYWAYRRQREEAAEREAEIRAEYAPAPDAAGVAAELGALIDEVADELDEWSTRVGNVEQARGALASYAAAMRRRKARILAARLGAGG